MLKIVCLVFFFALNLFSSDLNEQKTNFEIFLRTITGSDLPDINIELTDELVLLSGSLDKVERFKNALDQSLSSRRELENIINYKICVDDSSEHSECSLEPPANFTLTSLKQGKEQLQNLLGDALDEMCLDLDKFFSEKFGAKIDSGALCSRIFTTSSGTKETHESMRKNLLSCFANKTCLDIRRAWRGEEKLALLYEGIDEKTDSIFGLVNQLFTLTPVNASQHCFRIDLEGIFNLCHPPLSKITMDESGKATLTINKLHLLSYIKQLILGNVLLRVSKNSKGISASPMIISTKHALNRATTHYLVIDISKSMESSMHDLKMYLSEFLKHLRQENSASFVKFVFFNGKTKQYPKHNINDVAQLEEIINQQEAKGWTRLYGTLNDVLEEIKKNETDDNNISITLFTDGENTRPGLFSDIDIKNISAQNRPTSITFGLGEVDANLPNIALALGGKYYCINSICELKKILSDNALDMSSEHTFINFITKLGEEVMRESCFSVSNQKTGIFMPDIVLQQKKGVDATFCCGEQKISSFYEQNIKQADIFDQMKSIRAKAIEIAKTSSLSLNERQKKLQAILAQVPSFNDCITTFSQQQHVADTKSTINRLIDLIKKAKNDASLARSLEASIATLTGIY